MGGYNLAEQIVAQANSNRPTWDEIYQLEACLVEIEPRSDLERRLWSVRAEYRRAAGETSFEEYLKSMPVGGLLDPELLRADVRWLLAERQKLQMQRRAGSDFRMKSLYWAYAAFGTLFLFWASKFFWPRAWLDDPLGSLPPAIVFGGLGGIFSVMTRIRADEGSSLRSLESRPAWPAALGPMVGGVGAVITYMLFRSGLLSGQLFPQFSLQDTTLFVVKPGADTAKLLVWSFLAGFSEHFVRNTIDWLGNQPNFKESDHPVVTKASRRDLTPREPADHPRK